MKNNLPWEIPRFRNWVAVGKVNQLVRKAMSDGLSAIDLDLPHYDVLSAAFRFPGLTQSELAKKLLIGRSNLSMLLPDLERKGWIRRQPDRLDKRARRLFLTDEGEQQAEAGLAVQVRVIEHMLSILTEKECDAMGEMMRRVGQYLEKHPFGVESN